ncbi:MAG: sulfur carrier protein ThiS [Desulfuromonadaceae bacterium]|nr:sulfur carrier protein ThiS [Desulfuromonadaceae bacterium]
MSQLTVNGKPLAIAMPASVASLLHHLDFNPSKVAVELNGSIAPLARFDTTELNCNDRLELVCFVGGG